MLLTAAGAASVAVWLYLLAARGGFWRMGDAVEPGVMPGAAPSVVAVIPARNEAETVGRAVASLAAQRYPGALHIVLVDDASADGTGDAARADASPGILTVVRGRPLPPGWTGKLWAVDQGVREAARFSPDYLLLTDADIEHPPGNVAALVARAEAGGIDLVSYMATLGCRTFAERALIPAFVFFFFMLYPPAWVADPRRATAAAAGGCMLVKRTALERIGGLAAIRGELIDDCALARAVKTSGGRVWLGLSAATHSIRGYAGWAEIENMISRTAFTQLHYKAVLLAGTAAGLAVTYLLPPALAMGAPGGAARWLGAAAWVLTSAAWMPVLRFYRRSPLWAPFLPLVAAFYLGATFHSTVAYWRGRGGMWKGRAQAGKLKPAGKLKHAPR
jgi:hopene-associated glycosyltransferase HpnB